MTEFDDGPIPVVYGPPPADEETLNADDEPEAAGLAEEPPAQATRKKQRTKAKK